MPFILENIERPKPKFIYVENYGGFWKLKYDEWIAICLAAQRANFEGYKLPHNRALKRCPSIIQKVEWEDSMKIEHISFEINWPHILVSPLDWEPEAFKEWLLNNDP